MDSVIAHVAGLCCIILLSVDYSVFSPLFLHLLSLDYGYWMTVVFFSSLLYLLYVLLLALHIFSGCSEDYNIQTEPFIVNQS